MRCSQVHVLVRVSIAVKKHHDDFNWGEGLAYSFRGSAHYSHDPEHGGLQADVVLELRVPHLHSEATGSRLTVTLSEA